MAKKKKKSRLGFQVAAGVFDVFASAGAGLRFIMNQNFIVAFEYARCFNKQDGKGAFYINTGFLF